MSQNAIQVAELTKTFKAVTAVDELSFSVPEGLIAGFIGPNGSGKSTTMRILATLEQQDRGTAKIFDMDVRLNANRSEVRRMIGFMPDHFGLYQDMSAANFLDFFAAAYRIPPARRKSLVAELLELVDLTGKADAGISGLSRGMQQKLSLARCLVHDPRVLILDEPASGLDPRARLELLECLQELRKMGKTLLISSHILGELEQLCDMVLIIEDGKLTYSGSLEQAAHNLGRGEHCCIITVEDAADEAQTFLESVDGVSEVYRKNRSLHVTCALGVNSADLVSACTEHGLRIEEVRREQADLQQVFMQFTHRG